MGEAAVNKPHIFGDKSGAIYGKMRLVGLIYVSPRAILNNYSACIPSSYIVGTKGPKARRVYSQSNQLITCGCWWAMLSLFDGYA